MALFLLVTGLTYKNINLKNVSFMYNSDNSLTIYELHLLYRWGAVAWTVEW